MSDVPALTPTPGPAPAPGRSRQLRALLVLGLPLVGSHLAQFMLQITDTIMLGWHGTASLAAGVLGAMIFYTLFLFGSGFANAVMPMVASASAAGEDAEVRRVTRMGMWLSVGFALLLLPGMAMSGAALLALGQPEEVARLAHDYLWIAGFGMAPALVVMVLKAYLAALGRTQVVLWVTLGAVVLNIGLNWVLIFGRLGVPEMGVAGAALGSVILQLLSAVVLALYAGLLPALRRYRLFARIWRLDWSAGRRVFALGLPIGLAMLAESGLFAAASIMTGWLGTEALAAHGIAIEITAFFFMIHMGFSNAATVLVGRARGGRDGLGMRHATEAALAVSLGFAAAFMLLYWFLPEPMIALFLDPANPERPAIVAVGVVLLAVAALFQFADAVQVMAMGLLRGLQDTRRPMLIAAFSYWAVGVPASYVLGFPLGLGGPGLWLGLVIGLSVAAVLLLRRYLRLLRAEMADLAG